MANYTPRFALDWYSIEPESLKMYLLYIEMMEV